MRAAPSVRPAAIFRMVLPGTDTSGESLALDGQSLGFADKREHAADGQFLYRALDDIGSGTLRFDADMTFVHDVPPSPVIREGAGFLDHLNAHQRHSNPADAEIAENKYQGGYDCFFFEFNLLSQQKLAVNV